MLLQEGIGDTIRVSLTPAPGEARTREVQVAQEILQTFGLRAFTPMVVACPGCGRTTSTFFQELADKIQTWLRGQMPHWRREFPGVESMSVAVMGCVVNGPGESKHANIGISLPGSGEATGGPGLSSTAHAPLRSRASESQRSSRRSLKTTCAASYGAHHGRTLSIMATSPKTCRRARHERPVAGRCATWEWFEARVTDWLRSYGYRQIRTPIVEYTELFVRGIGEVTDIVENEMYSFEDQLNGERLTLRPEFTAGVVRAVVEHNLQYDGPQRVWSMGPVFRHERPQRGRYRQFHQVNVEAARLRRSGYRCRTDRHAGAAVEDPRCRPGRPCRLELNCLGQADER